MQGKIQTSYFFIYFQMRWPLHHEIQLFLYHYLKCYEIVSKCDFEIASKYHNWKNELVIHYTVIKVPSTINMMHAILICYSIAPWVTAQLYYSTSLESSDP